MGPRLFLHTLGIYIVIVTASTKVCAQLTRQYYIGAVEEEWDYAPGDEDRTNDHSSQGHSGMDQQSESDTFLQHGPGRIGRRYVKAMYREFTDDSFTQMKPREEWMGLLGPTIAGEEGDRLVVVFKNMAMTSGRNFSIYPRGLLQYEEGNEAEAHVLSVAPGEVLTYQWEVTSGAAPTTPDDPACLTRTYYSHLNTVRDVNSGLVGVLLTCNPGAMGRLHEQYARQFALLVNVFDENESWYIDHNIHTYLNLSSYSAQSLKQDQGFKESNMMRGLNGLMYGHLRGLGVCVGGHSLWHLISFGNEMDFHSLSINGHSFLVNQHRVDAISLIPGDFVTAELEAQTIGQWRLQSNALNHSEDGMTAFLNVSRCGQLNGRSPSHTDIQRFRRYYIAIKEVDWNYAPSGSNLFDGGDLLRPNSFSEKYFRKGLTRVGGVYRKAQFRQYEDVTFSKETKREEEEEHLGFLGPVLRVEVGDVVAVTLKNNAVNQAFSIHPHGASRIRMWGGEMSDDSVSAGRDPTDDFLEAGQVRTTYWFFPHAMGPGPKDPPCIARLYTSSSTHQARDAHSGLVGPILVCRRGALDRHDRQRQMDREFFLLFSVTDENMSWYSERNFGQLQADRNSKDFYQSNLMHGINGYLYGNLPGLTMCQGDRVSWHVLSVAGSGELHVHTVYFHGQPLTHLDSRPSATPLLPGSFTTLFMRAENPGEWALVDQTSQHYNAGSKALFLVRQCRLRRDYSVTPGGKNRIYFLQAEEELWDYAPSGMNLMTGKNLTDPDGESYIYTRNDGQYIGTRYRKVRYHRYTNATFSTKIRPDSEEYLGILGPIIMAEAFDVITVIFHNNASRNYSIHAQGLLYTTKQSEGSPYGGNTAGEVAPGETAVYEWSVPLDFAPAEGDPACISQAYYSAVDPVRDTNSGLVGPLVICKPGTIDPDSGERKDVDASFVLLFNTFDEGHSWYLPDNVQQFGTDLAQHDPTFDESNRMHSINGYLHANGPRMEVFQNSTVAWHLMTLGQQADLHSVRWQGNPVHLVHQTDHCRHCWTDAVRLSPGQFRTVRMNATRPGTWTVLGYVTGGMETAEYSVIPLAPATTTTKDPFGDVDVH